jgi:hypothetical protein
MKDRGLIMDVSQPNEEAQTDRAKAELEAVLNALVPSGLLYSRKHLDDLDGAQRKELFQDIYGPGDLGTR